MSVKRVKSKSGRQKATGHTPSGARPRQRVAAQSLAREAVMPYPRFNGDYTLPLVAMFVAFWSLVALWYFIPQSPGSGVNDSAEVIARENPKSEMANMEDEPADPRPGTGASGGSPLPISPRPAASAPAARLPVGGPADTHADPKKKVLP